MYSAWPLMVLGWPGGGDGNAGVPSAFFVFPMQARCLRYRWLPRPCVPLGRGIALADDLENKLWLTSF